MFVQHCVICVCTALCDLCLRSMCTQSGPSPLAEGPEWPGGAESTLREGDPGVGPRSVGWRHTSHFNSRPLVATLPDVWRNIDSSRTGWPCVSML